MTFNDLVTKDKMLRYEEMCKNKLISKQILDEYLNNIDEDSIIFSEIRNNHDDLLSTYFLVKGSQNGELLENIMKKYHCNYSAFIRNAIIILFGRESELSYEKTNPLDWPGIMNIEEVEGVYQLNTILGNIKLTKASPLFKNESYHYVFYNHLVSECFARSYDFIKEKQENCSVVLSYMPNSFYGGHYHAYLELDSGVLDIASNCFYFSKKDSSKILNGRIIRKLSYSEIEEDYSRLEEKYSDLHHSRYNELYALSLYYDRKNRFSSPAK